MLGTVTCARGSVGGLHLVAARHVRAAHADGLVGLGRRAQRPGLQQHAAAAAKGLERLHLGLGEQRRARNLDAVGRADRVAEKVRLRLEEPPPEELLVHGGGALAALRVAEDEQVREGGRRREKAGEGSEGTCVSPKTSMTDAVR